MTGQAGAAPRKAFAAAVAQAAGGVSPRLLAAFERVARERFLGPGPWWTVGPGHAAPTLTPDDDPSRVIADVAVAVDRDRHLYNGQPSQVARWLESLRIPEGGQVGHVGCGTGYYAAILAELVGATGHVTAFEIDPALARRASEALAQWPHASVVRGDAMTEVPAGLDALLVHAGGTHPRDEWLEAIADGGRLLLPLACTFPGLPPTLAKGVTALLGRAGPTWSASLGTPVIIYALEGARDEAMNAALRQALISDHAPRVTTLRRDAHARTPGCWFHGPTFCLTREPAKEA